MDVFKKVNLINLLIAITNDDEWVIDVNTGKVQDKIGALIEAIVIGNIHGKPKQEEKK